MKSAAQIEHIVLSTSPFPEIGYQRSYSAVSLSLLFFTFSGIGWLWEVMLHIIEDGMIINRGMLTGPWLPIYGTGGVMILVLLQKFREKPFSLLFMIMSVCGVVEYTTSILQELLFGTRWWDYSDTLLHINGRVCIEGLIIFGLGGLILVYIAAPKLDNLFQKIPYKIRLLLCAALSVLFLLDMIRSFYMPNIGFGITVS